MAALLVPMAPGAAEDAALPCDGPLGTAGAVCGVWVHWGDLPEPRSGHAAAQDEAAQHLYVHGGRDAAGNVRGDLYRFDYIARTWTAQAAGPARADAVLVHDPLADVLYLFGGTDGTLLFNDVWQYDTDTDQWSLLPTGPGPAPRSDAAGAWNPMEGLLTIFGGHDGTGPSGELWMLDPPSGAWIPGPNAPAARYGSAGVWDITRVGLLIHGGTQGSGPLNDVWIYESIPDRWTALAPSATPRAQHAAAWDPEWVNMLVFAGDTGAAADDGTWVFSPHLGLWLQQTPTPAAYVEAAGVWNDREEKAYLVGGTVNGTPQTGLWWFSPGSTTWAI